MSANESPPGPADQHGSSGQPSSVAPSQPQVLTTAPAQTISEYPISTVNGTVSYISRGVQTPDDWMLPVARAALESAAHSAGKTTITLNKLSYPQPRLVWYNVSK
ncbi:hypothetical protein F4678DRAFT_442111 [Xylaria arbuscula]|nr:hypothetical protein F4678DRAFT_442111 [Xylaria arbuscula]